MKPTHGTFRQSADHLLELKKGGGCVSLFGVPFFGAGLFMLLIVARLIPVSNASDLPWWAWLILAGMGLVFTAVGGVLVFGREWITVDNRQMRVWMSKGLMNPMRTSHYDLLDFKSVHLSLIPGDSETSDSYPIALVSAKGLPDLVLLHASTYGEARKQALLLGEFLSFPVTDYTTDNPLELQMQAETQKISPRPPAPSNPGFILRESDDELYIGILSRRHPAIRSLMGCIPLAIFLIFSYRFIGILFSPGTPWLIRAIFLSFFGIFFVLIPLIEVLKRVRRRGTPAQSLQINSLGMVLEDHAARKKLNLNWNELYEVDFSSVESRQQRLAQGIASNRQFDTSKIPNWVGKLSTLVGSKGLIIKASDELHNFGAGLSHDELVYLKAVVHEAMVKFKPAKG